MNFLLSINKKYILFISLIITCFVIFFILFKYIFLSKIEFNIENNIISDVDITEPKFAINSENRKILVTAKEGNFVDTNKILLRKNVLFKSNNFIIETDKVIFDRKEQTATSKTSSIFKSKNTKISSEGFDIYDNGNKIIFFGNSVIIIK